MKKLVLIALIICLTGCQSWIIRDEKTIIPETTTEYLVPEVNIDPYLLEDCKDQKLLESGSTIQEMLRNIQVVTSENTIIYVDCRYKHKSLVELLKRSLNLKDNK